MKFPYLFLSLMFLSAACKQDKEIKVYRVAKESPPPQPAAPAGDPHAGVPGLSPGGATPGGDPHAGLSADQLAAAGSGTGPKVTDTSPAGWTKQAATSMRQLSYRVDGEGGASTDISLIVLRGAAGAVLDNVNRWRTQLGQPVIDAATLKQTSQALTTPVGEAVLVEIEGLAAGADPLKDGRMLGVIVDKGSDGWFFKMRGNDTITAAQKTAFIEWVKSVKPADPAKVPMHGTKPGEGITPPSASPDAPAGDGSVTWQLPDGWTVVNGSSARYATIAVTAADGSKGELAVTHFPGDVGGDLANVNRWRGQIGLEPIDEAALAPLVSKLTAGSKALSVIDATGAQTRLAAGWTRHGAETWFFKLTGPDALVGAEKAKFTAFLESVRFTKPE